MLQARGEPMLVQTALSIISFFGPARTPISSAMSFLALSIGHAVFSSSGTIVFFLSGHGEPGQWTLQGRYDHSRRDKQLKQREKPDVMIYIPMCCLWLHRQGQMGNGRAKTEWLLIHTSGQDPGRAVVAPQGARALSLVI